MVGWALITSVEPSGSAIRPAPFGVAGFRSSRRRALIMPDSGIRVLHAVMALEKLP